MTYNKDDQSVGEEMFVSAKQNVAKEAAENKRIEEQMMLSENAKKVPDETLAAKANKLEKKIKKFSKGTEEKKDPEVPDAEQDRLRARVEKLNEVADKLKTNKEKYMNAQGIYEKTTSKDGEVVCVDCAYKKNRIKEYNLSAVSLGSDCYKCGAEEFMVVDDIGLK